MRATGVELYSEQFTEPISFSLREIDPYSRYNIKSIIGLDAEEIIRRFYGWGSNTNRKFYDFNLKARDIIMRIALSPRFELDEAYSDIRDELYRTISADRGGRIALHIKSGQTVVSRIYGYINKFEVAYFTKLPEVQITIHCDDPMFRAINPVIFDSEQLEVTNPIIIPDSLSTAPHGFKMQVTFIDDIPSFTVQDVETDPEWAFKIVPSGGFHIGDVLYISTEFSNRYVYLVRDDEPIQLLDKIEPSPVWPTIFPGANSFFFVDTAGFNWNELEFYAAYWGV